MAPASRWGRRRGGGALTSKGAKNPSNAPDSAGLPLTAGAKPVQFPARREAIQILIHKTTEGVLPDMNKNELIGAVAETSGLSRSDATKAVEGVFDTITGALSKGDEVRLVGFGTFSVAKRKASTGRNPRTGEPMTIKASNQPKFKAGKGLKDSCN